MLKRFFIVLFFIFICFILFFLLKKKEIKKVLIGDSFRSVYSYSGFFDNQSNLYYGVTRNGKNCRLFIYNFSKKQIEKVINLPKTSGSWSVIKKDNNVYIGTYNSALLYIYNIKDESLKKIADFNDDSYILDMVFDENYLYIATYPNARVYKFSFKEQKIDKEIVEVSESKYVRSLIIYDDYLLLGVGPNSKYFLYKKSNKELKEINLPIFKNKSFVYDQKIIDNFLIISVTPGNNFYFIDLNSFLYDGNLNFRKIEKNNSFNNESINFNRQSFFTLSGSLFLFESVNNKFEFIETEYQNWINIFVFKNNWYLINSNLEVFLFNDFLKDNEYFFKLNLETDVSLPMSVETYKDNILVGEHGIRVISNTNDNYYDLEGESKAICFLDEYVFSANYPSAFLYKIPVLSEENRLILNMKSKYIIKIGENQNRPLVIKCNKKNNFVAVGTEPDYGLMGGALVLYDSNNDNLNVYKNIIENQNVLDIVFDNESENILYFITIAKGGSGTDVRDESAFLVKFDYLNEKIIYKINIDNTNSMIKGINIINNYLIIWNTQGSVYLINKNNGVMFKKFKNLKIDNIEISNKGNIYAYDYNSIYRLDINKGKLSKIVDNFKNLRYIRSVSNEERMYYFDGFDYGYFDLNKF